MSVETDLDTLARTVFGEARSEPYAGQVAVAWVVVNRAAKPSWWGRTIEEVCKRPSQFSCWNYNDPSRPKLLAATLEDHHFLRAYGVAALVMTNTIPDPTQGATHYYASYIPKPSWADQMTQTVSLGLHQFYKDAEKA